MQIITTVLIVGAGKSSSYLIDTLLRNSNKKKKAWEVIVADSDEATLLHKVAKYPHAKIAVLDINNSAQREKLVKQADIVVSLMPPHLHILLAKDCLQYGKNLITSSYASAEMRELHQKAKDAGLMFMCEMGLDPGIDHMSASCLFDNIRKGGSEITSFKSFCGGLIAPESDDNPWHYKFSWNPRNIINAGKDGAHYLEDGKEINVAYEQLFNHSRSIYCDGVGELAYYANRDSLSYIDLYNLHETKNFMRATLRHTDFCKGWSALLKMGVTNTADQYDTRELTYKDWMRNVLDYDDTTLSVEEFAWRKIGIRENSTHKMVEWLNLFSDTKIDHGMQSSGDILLDVLNDKWKMEPEDKDMVVMQHEIEYVHRTGWTNSFVSSLTVIGESSEFSAMAKTVGMPMAILTELLVNKSIKPPTGVLIPTMSEVYRPVLNRLEKYGVIFSERFSTDSV